MLYEVITYYAQSALLANAQILPLSGHMGGVDIHLLESNDVPKPTDPIVEDKPVFNIHVFPNPVSDFVLVKRTPNLDETMRIKVYSIEGRITSYNVCYTKLLRVG